MLQFGGGAAADSPESTDDVVVFQLLDHTFVPPTAEDIAELAFDDGLGHCADSDENGGDAEEDQDRVEDAARARERMDLPVSHRCQGGEDHVEGVERRVMVNKNQANGPDE